MFVVRSVHAKRRCSLRNFAQRNFYAEAHTFLLPFIRKQSPRPKSSEQNQCPEVIEASRKEGDGKKSISIVIYRVCLFKIIFLCLWHM
jgi:hypothetical protein